MAESTEGLVPATAAAALVGGFQLLVTWFILGNEEVLLSSLPLTVLAVISAQSFTRIQIPGMRAADLRSIRILTLVALGSLVAFCFVAAIATMRGQASGRDPFEFAEWAITMGVVAVVFVADGYAGRRTA